MDEITKLKEIVSRWAADQPEIKRVWFFGSRAKSTHSSDSDLDVAVEIFKPKTRDNKYTFWCYEKERFTCSLAACMSCKLQLEQYYHQNHRIIDAVNDHGILVIHRHQEG